MTGEDANMVIYVRDNLVGMELNSSLMAIEEAKVASLDFMHDLYYYYDDLQNDLERRLRMVDSLLQDTMVDRDVLTPHWEMYL